MTPERVIQLWQQHLRRLAKPKHQSVRSWAATDGSNAQNYSPLAYLSQWTPIDQSLEWDFVENNTPNQFSWEETIKKCNTFQHSVEYARTLDPTAKLDYIPMAERVNCQWVGRTTLRCEMRGLLRWVGSDPPNTPYQMQKTKFFVCRRNVGATVEAVIQAPAAKHPSNAEDWTWKEKPDYDGTWMVSVTALQEMASKEIDAWKQKIPEGMGGYIDNLTPEDIYEKILDKEFGINDFYDWLKWRDSIRDSEEEMGEIMPLL